MQVGDKIEFFLFGVRSEGEIYNVNKKEKTVDIFCEGYKYLKNQKQMKYLFTTALIVGLASCGTTETETPVTPTGDTILSDSVYAANQVYQNAIADSIANVSDLLDTLAAYEPAAKMTH